MGLEFLAKFGCLFMVNVGKYTSLMDAMGISGNQYANMFDKKISINLVHYLVW